MTMSLRPLGGKGGLDILAGEAYQAVAMLDHDRLDLRVGQQFDELWAAPFRPEPTSGTACIMVKP
jgi:hypothetical protein